MSQWAGGCSATRATCPSGILGKEVEIGRDADRETTAALSVFIARAVAYRRFHDLPGGNDLLLQPA